MCLDGANIGDADLQSEYRGKPRRMKVLAAADWPSYHNKNKDPKNYSQKEINRSPPAHPAFLRIRFPILFITFLRSFAAG